MHFFTCSTTNLKLKVPVLRVRTIWFQVTLHSERIKSSSTTWFGVTAGLNMFELTVWQRGKVVLISCHYYHSMSTVYRASLNVTVCVFGKAEYYEPSHLKLLHILLGRFCNICLPAITPQQWRSVSWSVLAEVPTHVNQQQWEIKTQHGQFRGNSEWLRGS